MRKLLVEAFDDEELTEFCFDFPGPYIKNFSIGMSKSQKIQRLLDYCERQAQTNLLLNLIRERNPIRYPRYQDRLF